MAPVKLKNDPPEFLKSAIDFAKRLPEQLRTSQDATTLSVELRAYIKNLQSCRAPFSPDVQEILDSVGTELWNAIIRLKNDAHDSSPSSFVLPRVFAFCLIDCGHNDLNASYLSNCDEVEVAQKILERAAKLEDNLSKLSKDESEPKATIYTRLHNKYLGLRIVAAWKSDNLDLANIMFLKINGLADAEDAEEIADVLLEVGKDRLAKDDLSRAVTWLERSYHALHSYDLIQMSPDAAELKLNIAHNLVRALLKKATNEAREKAKSLIEQLDKDHGERIIVPLLHLEIIWTGSEFDPDRYSQVLHRLMNNGHMTDTNFQAIMQHIHKLKQHSAQKACEALDSLMMLRLISAQREDWIEKAFVTRVWISTEASIDSTTVVSSLEAFVDSVFAKFGKPLSEAAVHATHTLFWKRINSAFDQQEYNLAQSWCHIATHSMMATTGDNNRAKLQRKIMLCAIHCGDFSKARQTLTQMSELARAAPLTNYIMYKIALKDTDGRLASQCLEAISKHSSSHATLLYACVLESQKANNRQQAIIALQMVLQKCNARLLLSELQDNNNNHNVRRELCQLFQGVASKIQDERYSDQFTKTEIEWFIRNNYNLAVKYFGEWAERDTLTLLEACLTMFGKLPPSVEHEENEKLRRRVMICQSLASQTLLKMARSETSIAAKLQHYFHLREYVDSFRMSFNGTHLISDRDERQSLTQLFQKILLSDFEAAIHLKAWKDLDVIIQECSKRNNKQTFNLLVDMILSEEVPAPVALQVLESIMSDLASGSIEISKTTLAYWLRVLYQVSLSTDTIKSDIIVHRACTLASSLKCSSGEHYPQDELEWLAMTTYNRAIDAYCADELATSRKLAEQSFELAIFLDDGGNVRRMLMQKFANLQA